ncbi:uncharacterized protein LOC105846024 isoform X1 [Hydra vulgaris]|uniref:uncharacterized protein LOC105846024 isoform X1 n=2 Tax=Hydra vulgaris TaxID=6087 RepID=UPI0032EA48C4
MTKSYELLQVSAFLKSTKFVILIIFSYIKSINSIHLMALSQKNCGESDIFEVVQPSSAKLFSRERLLRKIQRYFSQDANRSPLVLYGMSGVGKTHIARKYCEISDNFYESIVWIDAAFGNLKDSMRNKCQSLGFNVHDSKGDYFKIEVVVELIHNYYKNLKTLFIFDNVDDESVKNLTMYISKKPNSFTLITSQWRTWSDNVNKILVDVFSSEEALAYVKNSIKEKSNENIQKLIKELGSHPFAITQAIKYINIYKISIEKYIDRFKSKPLEILDVKNLHTEEEPKSAIKAINLVLMKLEKTNSFPFQILNCLCHCDVQNISKQFIYGISNQLKINKEYVIDDAIALLVSYSLLNCFDDEKYSIHELTQLTCKRFQKKKSTTNMYLELFENHFKFELNQVKDHVDYGNHFVFHFIFMFRNNENRFTENFHHMTTSIQKLLVCKGLFKEAIEILKAIRSYNEKCFGENNDFTLDTKQNIAICLNDIGKYNEALEILYAVDKRRTELLGIDHQDTVITKHNIANCLYGLGKFKEALEIYYSVHKIRTKTLGFDNPDTMTTKNNIASCLYSMENYNEALEIYYSVEKIKTEILGINHRSTMETKQNIAGCLNNKGKYEEALEIYYSVNKIKNKILGINHPSTITTRNGIASCLYGMGKYNEALEIYCSIDKVKTEILSVNHPDTMTAKHNIANCLNNMGKYKEALEIYNSVDTIRTEILGIYHIDTMTTKHNIANCLNNLGRQSEALEIYYSVDKTKTQTLGINHQSTMTTKNSIASILYGMEKYNEALEIYYHIDKIKTESLGKNHPDTIITKHNIANCLLYIGKYNEALKIYCSVDVIRTKNLGIEHPDTLATKHNIALCLNTMGKYDRALEIYKSIDNIRTKFLGMKHPDTLKTKSNVALCLSNMGKNNDALEIYYSIYKIRTEVLGINHPDTMATKNSIANCLCNMGKYNEVLELFHSVSFNAN